jgi:hypothetical protein
MSHVVGREVVHGPRRPLGTAGDQAMPTSLPARAEVRGAHSVCLAAHISGGFKSRSARGHGPISNGGGHGSPAGARGRYGAPDTGTQAKAGDSQGGPEAPSCRTPEGRAPTARWGLKGLRRTPGSSSRGAIPTMHRSAHDGAWSRRHDGGDGAGFHPIAPRCVRTTRGGRAVCDLGRPGLVRTAGLVDIV